MKRELTDLEVTHVSYVKKGANKKEFILMKSDELQPNYTKEIDFIVNKSDDEQKLVYGVVYEPNAIDTQGEFARAESIEKASHKFLADCRNIDLQHNFQKGFGTVVESYIAPTDFMLEKQEIKKGSWVLVTKANDDVWESIKKGEITGYSMAGKAIKKEMEDDVIKKAFNSSEDDVKSLFHVMKSFFTGNNVEKSTTKGEIEMKKEDLEEIVKSSIIKALEPINDKLKLIEKEDKKDVEVETKDKKEDKKEDEVTKSQVEEIIKTALSENLTSVNERLTAIEKSKGVSRQGIEEYQHETVTKSVFAGLDIY